MPHLFCFGAFLSIRRRISHHERPYGFEAISTSEDATDGAELGLFEPFRDTSPPEDLSCRFLKVWSSIWVWHMRLLFSPATPATDQPGNGFRSSLLSWATCYPSSRLEYGSVRRTRTLSPTFGATR
ncbi:MAG: hypothetical protein HC767_11695, partial [Akkermansiaceae bacterium]|nr:hypothetical protein [Akkermansiaceae bacterium]